jgi:putative ABC transport system ATP-binding protein
MNTEKGTTLVLVTHNLELAQRTQRILRMRGGKLVEEYQVPNLKVQV